MNSQLLRFLTKFDVSGLRIFEDVAASKVRKVSKLFIVHMLHAAA